MSNEQFMQELKKLLKRLPHEEYNEAIGYYEQFFADGGGITETAKEVSRKILADFATDESSTKNTAKIWIIILSIFSMPILLPLGVAMLAVVIAMFAAVFALWASSVAILVGGVFAAIVSFAFITLSPWTTVFFVGVGCISLALGLLFLKLTWKLTKLTSKGTLYLFNKILRRVKK